MQEWIIQVMGQYGTWGIFFLIFIESIYLIGILPFEL